ncbi:MAG: ABC transporter permease [Dehalococcoidia bacterium]|nr:ABC transporter permease [Dehalococcoidia bacterium]
MELATRNFKEMCRDPLSMGLEVGIPAGFLVMFWALGRSMADESFLIPTMLAPGIAVFGFVFLLMFSAVVLAKDRESALLSRLLTAPLKPRDFILSYSLPYIPVIILQMALCFGIGALLGLEMLGNAGLIFLVLLVMGICCVELGMILGLLFTVNQVSGVGSAIITFVALLGGIWIDLEAIGGVFYDVGNALPFAHAIDAARDVIIGADFSSIATDFYWVLGYTLLFFTLGIFLFRRRMVE